MNWEKGVAELEGESERVTIGSRESAVESGVRVPFFKNCQQLKNSKQDATYFNCILKF